MVFSYPITTPANTPERTPLVSEINIARGVIHHWEILFPSGAMGEHRLRINKGSEHLLPRNPLSYLLGDNHIIQGDDFLYIKNPPYKLLIISWNLDTNYEHTAYIHIFIKPLWTFSPYSEQILNLIEEEEFQQVF